MKIRKTKKGFTIVELVIVIAVIGILAAILIPTFIGLTNRANEASDNALVNNLNKALKMEEGTAGHEKSVSMQGAINDLKNQGYLLNQISSKSGKVLVWDQVDNQFLLNDAAKGPKDDARYWKIANGINDDAQHYSIYAGEGWNQAEVSGFKFGFDAGERTNITKVTYASSDANEVVIRTNSYTTDVVINTEKSVQHFGNVGKLDIQKVAMASFHEFGNARAVTLKEGNFVIENKGSATVVSVVATETGKVKLDIQGELDVLAGDPTVYQVTAGTPKETADTPIAPNTVAIIDGDALEEITVADFADAEKVILLKDFTEAGLVLNHDIEITGNMTKLNAELSGNGKVYLKNIHTTNIHGSSVSGKTYLYNGINFNGEVTFDGGYLEYDGTLTSNAEKAAFYANNGYGKYTFKNMVVSANTNKGIKISKAQSVTIENCEFDAKNLKEDGSIDNKARSLSAIDIQEQNGVLGQMTIKIAGCLFRAIPQGQIEGGVADSDTAGAIKIKTEKSGAGFVKVTIKDNKFENCYRDVVVGCNVYSDGTGGKTLDDMNAAGNQVKDNPVWEVANNTTTLTAEVIANRGTLTYSNRSDKSQSISEKVGRLEGGCGLWETFQSARNW